jgi:DNA-binding MarR family transcriptional regulator
MVQLMRTHQGNLLTDVVLAVFRANGRLLSSGDALVAPLGLTSARWQVLGAVGLSDKPISAPQIASVMGVTRQGAQKQIHRMVKEDLLESVLNPAHKRSPLYALTEHGRQVFAELESIQAHWISQIAEAIPPQDLETAKCVLDTLTERLTLSSERSADS